MSIQNPSEDNQDTMKIEYFGTPYLTGQGKLDQKTKQPSSRHTSYMCPWATPNRLPLH